MAQFNVQSEAADFTLTFSCAKWQGVWDEAVRNVGVSNLTSVYEVVGADAVFSFAPDPPTGGGPVLSGGNAFFFDNVSYDVWLEFDDACTEAAVVDEARTVEEAFTPHRNGKILTGRIDFKNDVGRADFSFGYKKNGLAKVVTFTFEVLSSKLDYHHDWQLVFTDVERKYPLLAADYLKRTYHAFDRTPKTDALTPDVIWWNLFKEEQEPFIRACAYVVSRPRRKLRPAVDLRRADQLRRVAPAIENEFAEHRRRAERLYRVEREDMSHDTVENRFVKYAVRFVSRHYEALVAKIRKGYDDRLSASERDEMAEIGARLKRLVNHPFFRDVGRFTGLRQESLILQRAPGYATVWRSFGILNASYMLYDGTRRLQTKNVADLYEIWCFIKVEEIVRACCAGCEVVENYKVLDERFVQQLDEGEGSSVIFKDAQSGVELAKLIYNLNVPFKGISQRGTSRHEHVFTPTSLTANAEQKPDIVLRLTKALGGDGGFKMTYLFDAKYRIGERYDRIDYPPQDALNQMHRYRDAIYFGDARTGRPEVLKKEVIGGYILFPGAGLMPPKPEPGQPDLRPRFLKSVDRVNVGAFPLRPGSAENVSDLKDFIQAIVNKNPEREVIETIAQKGTVHVLPEDVQIPPNRILSSSKWRTSAEEARWIYRHKMFFMEVSDYALQIPPDKVKLISIPWYPVVTLIVEKCHANMMAPEIAQLTGETFPFPPGVYHVWEGKLANAVNRFGA